MGSSDGVGRSAVARTGVEIGSAPRAEAGAIFPAQQKDRNREGELLADRLGQIDCGSSRGDRIDARIIGRVGILAEQQVQLDINRLGYLGQAAPAPSPNLASHLPSPEELSRSGFLQAALDRYRSGESQLEARERRIGRLEHTRGIQRTAVNFPQIHA